MFIWLKRSERCPKSIYNLQMLVDRFDTRPCDVRKALYIGVTSPSEPKYPLGDGRCQPNVTHVEAYGKHPVNIFWLRLRRPTCMYIRCCKNTEGCNCVMPLMNEMNEMNHCVFCMCYLYFYLALAHDDDDDDERSSSSLGIFLRRVRLSAMQRRHMQHRSVHPYVYRLLYKSRAIAGRTARCRCKFRYVSNFTTALCGFSATSRLSCWSLSADCSE